MAVDVFAAQDVQRSLAHVFPPAKASRLGEWVLRFTERQSGNYSSVHMLGDPGMPFVDALTYASDWYARRGAPTVLCGVVPNSHESALNDGGWAVDYDGDVFLAASSVIDAHRGALPHPLFNTVAVGSADRAHIHAFLGTVPVAVTRVTVCPAVGSAPPMVGVSGVWVSPDHRRQRIGEQLMNAAADWAADRDVCVLGAHVLASNPGAQHFYRSLGFTRHHTYRFWSRTPD